MKSFFRLAIVLLVGATCFSQRLLAQVNGSISGRVTDSSKSVLQGAAVELQPGNIVVVSDAQGRYYVKSLTPGTYTITITYVGFTLFTTSLEITSGHNSVVDAEMRVASASDQVLVTAERPSGEAEDINRQRTADNGERADLYRLHPQR